jgi:tRNA(Met) cytidine acetyltransferase
VIRGEESACRAAAERIVAGHEHVLVETEREARALLGRSVDAVVLDATRRLDADALGIAHGAVRAGGGLVLLLSEPAQPNARLAIAPFDEADVGSRFRDRLLARLDALGVPVLDPKGPLPALAPVRIEESTDEQGACVRALVERLREPAAPVVVTAHRGRGKSAALGLAARELLALGRSVAVTGPSQAAVAEVVRFGEIAYVAPSAAAHAPHDVLLIDEAAAIPVPLLRALVDRPSVAFATTVHGYEGTGRGFALRLRPMLRERFADLLELTLVEPIRFGPDDPLERAVFDLLALDASAPDPSPSNGAPRLLSKDALARHEPSLRAAFGLLVDAHYRTTPGDLERMLDAPNLDVRAIDRSAVALVAREGRLSSERIASLAEGRSRIRGHALAELFVSHLGIHEGAALDMRRIVRIAVHPERRRRGLGTELVRSIEDADLCGALFGADAELARFWISAGFSLVHVGTARGSRSGEPSLAFVRALSDTARPIVARASARAAAFGRFYGRDPAFLLARELAGVLEASFGPPAPPDPNSLRAYAYGPRPFETVLPELDALAREHDLGDAPILAWRVRDRLDWPEVARRAEVPLKTAMRRARVETRALLERTVP